MSSRTSVRPAPRLVLPVPSRLGEHTVLERLGADYLARDADGGLVVLSVLPWVRGPRSRAVAQARLEAAAQASSRHLARVVHSDVGGDKPHVVGEYVDGPSLRDVVGADGPLPAAELAATARRTAAALAALHRAGTTHGAFEPGRVLYPRGGAKVTGAGTADPDAREVAHPAYQAPEHIEDEPVGAPADVWAWAATLVYAATGHPPFGFGAGDVLARRITSRPPDLGDLDGPLRDLLLRCLDKDPEARPTTSRLVRVLRDEAPHEERTGPRRIPRYRWRMMVALGGVVGAGFGVGIVW
ncbi:protein kinase domain-containing protein [Actinomadura flavalba]|uniref:protein kinase domain-containing protein n=1 Tax=Actinomadura flavalba TaxID=1120938 RepID=UPI000475F509|nr:protein kinase [Actinomadura flavalba]